MYRLFSNRLVTVETVSVDFSAPPRLPVGAVRIGMDKPAGEGEMTVHRGGFILYQIHLLPQTLRMFLECRPESQGRLCDARFVDAFEDIARKAGRFDPVHGFFGIEGFVFFPGTTFIAASGGEYALYLNLTDAQPALRYLYDLDNDIRTDFPVYVAALTE